MLFFSFSSLFHFIAIFFRLTFVFGHIQFFLFFLRSYFFFCYLFSLSISFRGVAFIICIHNTKRYHRILAHSFVAILLLLEMGTCLFDGARARKGIEHIKQYDRKNDRKRDLYSLWYYVLLFYLFERKKKSKKMLVVVLLLLTICYCLLYAFSFSFFFFVLFTYSDFAIYHSFSLFPSPFLSIYLSLPPSRSIFHFSFVLLNL